MPKSNALDRLKEAIKTERENAISRLSPHEVWGAKILLYQDGQGPAPTIDEFLHPPRDAKQKLALQRLLDGNRKAWMP